MKAPLFVLALLHVAAAAAPVLITSSGTYSQNFNSLTPGSSWTDDSTLPGWYYQRDLGTVTFGLMNESGPDASFTQGTANNYHGNYLYANTSNPTNYSMGGAPTTTGFGNEAYGVLLQNNTASPASITQIRYEAEIWRVNQLTDITQGIYLGYQVSPSPISVLTPSSDAGWTLPGSTFDLTFTSNGLSGLYGFAANTPVDGKNHASRAVIDQPLNVVLAPGEYILLRWRDPNEASTSDAHLAIDNVQITFTAVPEPSTFALMGIGLAVAGLMARRRR